MHPSVEVRIIHDVRTSLPPGDHFSGLWVDHPPTAWTACGRVIFNSGKPPTNGFQLYLPISLKEVGFVRFLRWEHPMTTLFRSITCLRAGCHHPERSPLGKRRPMAKALWNSPRLLCLLGWTTLRRPFQRPFKGHSLSLEAMLESLERNFKYQKLQRNAFWKPLSA